MPSGVMTDKNMLWEKDQMCWYLSILAMEYGVETPRRSPEPLDLKLQ